jgi:hypothetical protein
MSHEVISDTGFRGDPTCESSGVKVLTRAGQAERAGRSIKRTLQLREDISAGSGLAEVNVVVERLGVTAKTAPAEKTSLKAPAGATGVVMTARRQRTGRVNWGPSASWRESAKRPGGHKH